MCIEGIKCGKHTHSTWNVAKNLINSQLNLGGAKIIFGGELPLLASLNLPMNLPNVNYSVKKQCGNIIGNWWLFKNSSILSHPISLIGFTKVLPSM